MCLRGLYFTFVCFVCFVISPVQSDCLLWLFALALFTLYFAQSVWGFTESVMCSFMWACHCRSFLSAQWWPRPPLSQWSPRRPMCAKGRMSTSGAKWPAAQRHPQWSSGRRSIALKCRVRGNNNTSIAYTLSPSGQFYWICFFLLDNARVEGAVMTISNAKPANQGQYRCTARNAGGRSSATAVLNVKCELVFTNQRSCGLPEGLFSLNLKGKTISGAQQ